MITVHIAFIVWALLGAVLFFKAPPRPAVLITVMGGSLFLPNAGYDMYGLHQKDTIIASGVLLWSLLFHARLWLKFRFRLLDLPMLVWCFVSPFASSITNSLGVYDALSALIANVLIWGVPYLLGRIYFSTVEGLRELAIGLMIGALVYVPFCLYEVRMSPQLHAKIYGFFQHDFSQHMRYGGFRPAVFKYHGLAVSLFMSLATLQAVWLWRSRALKHIFGIPMGWIVLTLLVTLALCRSLNGIVLLALGTAVYFLIKTLRTAVPILCLLALAPAYMFTRGSDSFSATSLVSGTQMIQEDRADSLKFRIDNENLLIEKAAQKKVLGWGRWGRARVYKGGRDITITDGLWIIAFGNNGLLGLVSLTALLLLPVIVLLLRCPARYWTHRKMAPVASLALLLPLYMIDNLFNDVGDPVFIIAAGAIMCLKRRSILLALNPYLTRAQPQLGPALVPQVAITRAPSY